MKSWGSQFIFSWKKALFALLIFIQLGLNTCVVPGPVIGTSSGDSDGGVGSSGTEPSGIPYFPNSGDNNKGKTILKGTPGEEGQPLIPDTILYFYIEDAEAVLAKDGKTIQVKGYTVLAQNDQPMSTKVKVTKKGSELSEWEYSGQDGFFNITIEADPMKAVEILNVVTVDDQDQATSEKVELIVEKLFGRWQGQVNLNEQNIRMGCFENIPELENIAKKQDIYFYRPTPFEGEIIVRLFGINHKILVDKENKLNATGSMDIAQLKGLDLPPSTGCYRHVDYQLSGEVTLISRPDGLYSFADGELALQFNGENCTQTCQINNEFKFKRAFAYPYFNPEEEVKQSVNLDEKVSLRLAKLHQIEITEGPIKEFRIINANSVLGISASRLYQFDFGEDGVYSARVLFDLNQYYQENPPEGYYFGCQQWLQHLAYDAMGGGVIISHRPPCTIVGNDWGNGFFYLNPKAENKIVRQPLYLDSYLHSPVFYRNQLIYINTSSKSLSLPYFISENPLSSSRICSFKITPQDKKLSSLGCQHFYDHNRVKYPMALALLNNAKLLIIEGVYKEIVSWDKPHQGFMAIASLSNDDGFQIKIEQLLHPYIPKEAKCDDVFCLIFETPPYAHDLFLFRHVPLNKQKDKLFLTSRSKFDADLSIRENELLIVDLNSHESMPEYLQLGPPSSEETWVPMINMESESGGLQKTVLSEDFLYLISPHHDTFKIEDGAYQEEQKGAKISVYPLKNYHTLEQFKKLRKAGEFVINKDEDLGDQINFGNRLLISVGKNIYQITPHKKYLDTLKNP